MHAQCRTPGHTHLKIPSCTLLFFLGVLFNLENISGCVFNFRYNCENIIGRFIVCVYVCVCLSMDLVQGKMYSLWIMVKIV